MRDGRRWGRFRWRRAGVGSVLAVSLLIYGARGLAQDATQTETQQTMAAALGKSVQSDYVAKHFTLLFGGVVLNQFKISETGTGADKQLFLDDGSTDAKAFIEGGFRWRWAWLDRDSLLTAMMRDSRAQDEYNAVALATDRRKAAQQALRGAEATAKAAALKAAASQEEDDAPAAAAPEPRTGTVAEENKGDQDAIAEAATDLAAARIAEARARAALTTKARDLIKVDTGQLTPWSRFYSLGSRIDELGWFALIPDDYVTRLGFVFDSDSSNDAISTVGSSDVYTELGIGWNLVRWSFPTRDESEPPIRGALNLEFDGMAFTDDQINDVHGRGIGGLAFVFGVPLTFTSSDPRDEVDPTVVPNAPVAELVTRLGAVIAETPQFVNKSTNELVNEHGNAAYEAEWGFGLDIELNVPITERLGYLMARAQVNSGFDPNPWFISLGYTIPLSTMASAITSGG